MLLMGDAERRVEEKLVATQRIQPATIIEAGHHGSRSSSSESFVMAAQARHVVFSAGYRNRWDFPRAEVVARWRRTGARTESTIDDGAVTYTLLATGAIQLDRYRQQHPHYWLPH